MMELRNVRIQALAFLESNPQSEIRNPKSEIRNPSINLIVDSVEVKEKERENRGDRRQFAADS